jgi:hypothetical protein
MFADRLGVGQIMILLNEAVKQLLMGSTAYLFKAEI